MTLLRNARVLLVSEHRMVAETLAAALEARGVDTRPLRCPVRTGAAAQVDVGMVLSELDQTIGAREVRALVLALPTIPWIVVTTTPYDATWGALLAVDGALTVLDQSTSLDEIVATVAGARATRLSVGAEVQRGLVRDQRAARHELERLRDRMRALSPAERSLLRLAWPEPSADGATSPAVADRQQRRLVVSVLHELDRAAHGSSVALPRAAARRRTPRPWCARRPPQI